MRLAELVRTTADVAATALRRGVLSNLHLGARDGEEGFAMFGKTFEGLADERLAWPTRLHGAASSAPTGGSS